MKTVAFTDDQMVTLLEFLEEKYREGYDLKDVIEGIQDGTVLTNQAESFSK